MNNACLYNIVTEDFFNFDGWKLQTYQTYLDYVNKNIDKNCNDLYHIIEYCIKNHKKTPFKWCINIGTMQFLAAIFPEEKLILMGSKQLSFELTLVDLKSHSKVENYDELKSLAKKIAQIPVENSPTQIEVISSIQNLDLFNTEDYDEVHNKTRELSKELSSRTNEYKQSLFEKVSDFGLDLTAKYMLIRIHLLKFLAILPNLDHDKNGLEVKRIFLETLRRLSEDSELAKVKKLTGQKRPLPDLYVIVIKMAYKVCSIIPAGFLARSIRYIVGVLAKRFIAGTDIQNAKKSLQDIMSSGRDATIDQLGELVVSNKEADRYTNEVIELIEGMEGHISKGSKNSAGINKAHVSIKVSALCNDFKPQDFDYSYAQCKERLKKILVKSKKHDVFLNIDAEHYHYRDTVFNIYKKILMETPELKDFEQTGIVVQAYLRDGINHLNDVINLAKERKIKMPIRLVKGAYWDAETIEADAHSFNAPEFLNKEETDIHYRQLIVETLKASDHLVLAVASHNIQDHCFAEAVREIKFPQAPIIEHQCLHMTYEALSIGLNKMNWPTRNYIPVGNLLVGMAYLVRRIMENSSQVGILTIMRSHKKSMDIKTPSELLKLKKDQLKIEYDKNLKGVKRNFKNIYPVRTYIPSLSNLMKNSIDSDLARLKSGNLFHDNGDIKVVSNSNPDLHLGNVQYDTTSEVQDKIEKLFTGYNSSFWKENRLLRYNCLLKLADLLLIERESLSSLIMLEAGKSLDEAIADVDEAVDFINFYVREQIKIDDYEFYHSFGVVGVIAPWNFPLAIPCGMTIAALVAGNSALLKPAEQTMLIALKFQELAYKAGIPEDIFQVSLGDGEVGKEIVSHELICGIVFTGSKEVGTSIYKAVSGKFTSDRYDYRPRRKFVITEMGGKNAIIVTNNSELDETVSGILYSAFAHAGQKCSACSRIIIDNEIKDSFIARFKEAVNDIKVGGALDFSTFINPLISKEDQDRVRSMAIKARDEVNLFGGKVIIDRSQEDYIGTNVGPSVFELSKNTVLQEKTIGSTEVFGPLIHIIGYDHIDEAIDIFNSTEFALTGGIFCQSQDDIDYIVPKLEAGNIYINRPNTGARVAIEPFGGFKMSGTGPKAGGIDYLVQFNRQEFDLPVHKKSFIGNECEEILDSNVYVSKLSFERKRHLSKKLLKILTDQFEVYFGIITEKEKKKLLALTDCISQGDFDLESREFPNRYIPGQLSFSKKNLALGKGVFVDASDILDVDFLADFIVNLIIGNGIVIMALNNDLYKRWQKIIDLAYSCGFSSYNIKLLHGNEESLNSFLNENTYEFVLFSSMDLIRTFSKTIMKKDFENSLPKLFCCSEHRTFDDAIEAYANTRSYAINTMRHGAPLELTL